MEARGPGAASTGGHTQIDRDRDCLLGQIGEKLVTVSVCGWIQGTINEGAGEGPSLRDPSGTVRLELRDFEGVLETGSYVSIHATFNRHDDILTAHSPAKVRTLVPPPATPTRTANPDPLDDVNLSRRYLELRSKRMQDNLRLVDSILESSARTLRQHHFIYVETPYLSRTLYEYTENDFVVSSPLWAGQVAHLAQSPQMYKQLLMAGGVERYFQFPRNFRAEPGGPTYLQEFTQIDAELVTSSPSEIRRIMEAIVYDVVWRTQAVRISTPFPEVRWGETRPDNHPHSPYNFVWKIAAPIAQRTDNGRIVPSHHAVSQPRYPEQLLDAKKPSDLLKIEGTGFDLELDGLEIGGGDLRIINAEVQQAALRQYGLDASGAEQFEPLLRAMADGVPQHGGFALGLSRLAMVLSKSKSLEAVQAFPMNYAARNPLGAVPFRPGPRDTQTMRHQR